MKRYITVSSKGAGLQWGPRHTRLLHIAMFSFTYSTKRSSAPDWTGASQSHSVIPFLESFCGPVGGSGISKTQRHMTAAGRLVNAANRIRSGRLNLSKWQSLWCRGRSYEGIRGFLYRHGMDRLDGAEEQHELSAGTVTHQFWGEWCWPAFGGEGGRRKIASEKHLCFVFFHKWACIQTRRKHWDTPVSRFQKGLAWEPSLLLFTSEPRVSSKSSVRSWVWVSILIRLPLQFPLLTPDSSWGLLVLRLVRTHELEPILLL